MSRLLPLALAFATSPALAQETARETAQEMAASQKPEEVFQYGGPLSEISDATMQQAIFAVGGIGRCDLSFPEAQEFSKGGSYIRPMPDGTWCTDWPHRFIGRTADGKAAFAEFSADGEPQSCYTTLIYNGTHPDALKFSSDGNASLVRTVSLPSVLAQDGALTQMMPCSDVQLVSSVDEQVQPEVSQEPHPSAGLPVFARLSYFPTWAGFADGSLQYREGMIEGMPGLPPARFQGQVGMELAPWFVLGAEAGVSFAESGSGLTNVGGLLEFKVGEVLDFGLSGGVHWEPSEPEAEVLQGIPYMALGLRHDFPVVGPLLCGAGVVGEQVFPAPEVMGFAPQPGMFALGAELGCVVDGHVVIPSLGSTERKSQPKALHFEIALEGMVLAPEDVGPAKSQPGEAQRLREEMGVHAKNQRWSAVEKTFDQIPETERTYNDYYQAAFSARDVGDVALMLSRLQKAQMISNTQEVQDWIRDVKLNYAYVRLDETVSGKPEFLFVSSFDPNQRHALDFAKGQYEAEGSFEGFLPIGVQVTLGGVPLPPLKPYGEQKAVQVLTLED